MTREIIEQGNYGNISVVTFWMGKEEGVQITIGNKYVQMPREKAIKFLKEALKELEKQIKEDKIDPPFWQVLGKEKKK